jgi:glycosyltransferase involved in cell wall biosynthesis
MRSAVCLVLPSFSEGLGRVVLEAMACGRPVIGTRVGGIPEMIEDEITGLLVSPGDPNGLAESLLRLLEDPKLAEAMGRRGRAKVESLFTEEKYFRGFTELLTLADAVGRSRRLPTAAAY